jgi:polysaccharide export outer membrane protein
MFPTCCIGCADHSGMRPQPLSRILVAMLMLSSCGCSNLGLSLQNPTQLTKQAKSMLQSSPHGHHLPRELNQTVLPDHYLQPGDALLIETIDLASDIRLPADQRVMADGRIDLGRFGRINVAGLTLEETEDRISRVIQGQNQTATQVNVRLLEPVHRYYVLGEVNSPGSYPLVGHETVLDGILAGGGLTGAAAPCTILLARPTATPSCRVTLPICYHEITQLGDTTTNYQLQPGDRIYVASRSWCEELRFWEASHTCDRCQRCQVPCSDPAAASYSNPITMNPASSRLPPTGHESIGAETAGPESPPAASESDVPTGTLSQPLPSRLPKTIDGELDFGIERQDSAATGRFEPLWISPPLLGS